MIETFEASKIMKLLKHPLNHQSQVITTSIPLQTYAGGEFQLFYAGGEFQLFYAGGEFQISKSIGWPESLHHSTRKTSKCRLLGKPLKPVLFSISIQLLYVQYAASLKLILQICFFTVV